MKYNRIDEIFKGYAIDYFGAETMKKITDSEIETARIFAFTAAGELAKLYIEEGKSEKEYCDHVSVKNMFLSFIESLLP